MAINLPNSPTNGQTVTLADKTLVYNSTSGTWNVQTTDSSGGSLSISDTAPSSPSDGDMWFDSSTLTLYAYYDDGNSQQWIDLAGQATTLQATSSDTAPANPSTGAIWFDTANLNLFVYYSDGSSNQWVQMNSEAPAIPEDLSDLTDTTNLLFDGQYSSLTGAPTSSTASALGTLTKTFTQNEEAEITLSENISPVPNVSVFKEVPQGGLSSKGNWDVNANATNYEFFDEKPLNYNTTTLTPSATGDGTFTSSNPTVTNYVHSKLTADNSGLSNSGSPLHTLVTNAGTHDNQGTLDMYGVWMSPAGDKILAIQVFTNNIYRNRLHGFNVANPFSTTDADITYQTTGNGYYDIADGTTNDHRNATFGIDPTGTHLYTFRNNTLYQYVATTGWEASTFSFTNNTFVPSGNGIPPNYDWQCPPTIPSNNGDYLLFCSANDGYVARYTMTTAWDCSTCSSKQELDAATLLSNAGYTSTFFRSAQYNSDGTLLLLGNNDQFFKLSLSTPYDITTASFVEASSSGLTLGYYGLWITSGVNEGKYVVGQTGNVSGGIVIQPTSESVAFSSTDVGKKVVGNSGAAVITATSGTYTSVTPFADTSAISSWQLFGAQGKADGSGIELSGYVSGYNHSSLSYDNKSFSFNSEDSIATAIAFNDTGTKMYMAGGANDRIYQYSLSTAYDISTLSYDNISLAQAPYATTSQQEIAFKSDGSVMYISDNSDDSIDIWTVSSGNEYIINQYSYSSTKSLSAISNITNLRSVKFKSDGSKFFALDLDTNTVYEFTMSTAWDVANAQHSSGNIYNFTSDISEGSARSIYVTPDGTELLITGNDQKKIDRFVLSTPWQINTASFTGDRFDYTPVIAPAGSGVISSMITNDTGTKIYLNTSNNDTVFQYNFGGVGSLTSQYIPTLTNSSNGQINSSHWVDIDSMVADETKNDGDVFYAVSTDDRTSWGVIKDGDGVRKIAKNNSGTWQYNNDTGTTVTIGYDLANGSFTTLSSHLSQNEGYMYMHFKPDGTKVWVGGQTSDTIFEYDIGTAFDLSTVSYGRSKAFSISTQSRGFFFKPDGTRAYISDRNNYIRQLNMNTAWNISTAQTAYDEYNMNTTTSGIFFKPDGTKFYNIDDGTGRELKQFSMSTAWDITTASLDYTVNLPSDQGVSNQGVALAGNDIWFSSDGTYFFLPHGNTGNPVAANSHIDILKGVAKFSLSTAWDISSTITYLENITQVDQNGAHLNYTPNAVNFNSDGSKMYTIVSENSSTSPAQRIMEFSTGGTTTNYGTSETWVDGTHNNEHATLQEALGAQSFNRMDKAQLQAVTDPNHYVLGDTLDLMIAPYAASGTSPLSDGVTIGYQADALIKQAINGTDYEAEFPATNKVKIKSLAAQNLKIRII